MSRQIHGVMKEAQHIDHVTVRLAPDAKHDDMTPFAARAGDVKGKDPLENIVPLSCARRSRAGGQGIQRCNNRFGVNMRLHVAELVDCPEQDVLKVNLGGRRQADPPPARSFAHFERVAGFRPIALSAMSVK